MSGNPIIPQDAPLSAPTVANGVVYFGVRGDGRGGAPAIPRVYAIADQNSSFASAGQVLWQSQVYGAHIQTAPTVVNGRVYVATYDGKVYAYGAPGH